MTAITMTLGGEDVLALPERALYWPKERTLFAADVHFGKDATFRQAQSWVPPGTTSDDLARLNDLLERHRVNRVVILGDVFHSEHAGEEQTLNALKNWRASIRVEMVMIRGNHDRRAEELARVLEFQVKDEGYSLGPWSLCHHPPRRASESYVLCGHVHPVVVMQGQARQRRRVPCFWANRERCILPAFGGFTGGSVVKPKQGDRVVLVVQDRVLDVS